MPGGEALLERLARFVRELRAAGLPVGLTEGVDAAAALRHVALDDREVVREALAATLVKSAAHRRAFDTVFDVWFSPAPAPVAVTADAGGDAGDEDLVAALERALAEGDTESARLLASEVVTRFAGIERGRRMRGAAYLVRALRRLDLEAMVERLAAPAGDDPLAARLARDDAESAAARVRDEIEAEIRRRLVADLGPEAVGVSLRRPLPEDVDFLHATPAELADLRRAVEPLGRRLAARLGQRRRHRRRGPLDFRNTMRHSLSYGGVPAEPRFRHRRPAKPDIVVLADVSGSVAAFARFTLQLVHVLASQFSRVRSFVFVDGVDEVTSLLQDSHDLADALRRIDTEADAVWADGHSDYGHALEAFWARWADAVGPRTTVIILGDARSNYHPASAWVVREIRRRARRVYWLNPEPRSFWDTGDSVAREYAAYCDATFECRNLRQLARFVSALS